MNSRYSQIIQWILILGLIGSCGKASFFESESGKKKEYSENKSADAFGNDPNNPSSDSDGQMNGDDAAGDSDESKGDNGAEEGDCIDGECSGQAGSDQAASDGDSDSDSDSTDHNDSENCDTEMDCSSKEESENCQDDKCEDGMETDDQIACEGKPCESDDMPADDCDSGMCDSEHCKNKDECKDCEKDCPDCPNVSDPPEIVVVEDGIVGGHFDVDTFYRENLGKDGKKGKKSNDGFKLQEHVHEYDDKYSTNGVNFFGPSNGSDKSDKVKIDDLIPANLKFGIKLVNAKFNQGGFLYIGETAYGYNNLPDPQKEYTKADLAKLSIVFDLDSLTENGIQPATPKWVKDNELGPENSHRSGALTFQIIDLNNGDVLIECSVYWHKDGLKKMSFL